MTSTGPFQPKLFSDFLEKNFSCRIDGKSISLRDSAKNAAAPRGLWNPDKVLVSTAGFSGEQLVGLDGCKTRG